MDAEEDEEVEDEELTGHAAAARHSNLLAASSDEEEEQEADSPAGSGKADSSDESDDEFGKPSSPGQQCLQKVTHLLLDRSSISFGSPLAIYKPQHHSQHMAVHC